MWRKYGLILASPPLLTPGGGAALGGSYAPMLPESRALLCALVRYSELMPFHLNATGVRETEDDREVRRDGENRTH